MSRLTGVGALTIDILVCAQLAPHAYANAAHKVALAIIAPGQTRTQTRRHWKTAP